METLVVDASIAVKWVVVKGSKPPSIRADCSVLWRRSFVIAADASILWKMVQRGELARDAVILAASLLERSGITFVSMTGLLPLATVLAVELLHRAYDCTYPVFAAIAAGPATGCGASCRRSCGDEGCSSA